MGDALPLPLPLALPLPLPLPLPIEVDAPRSGMNQSLNTARCSEQPGTRNPPRYG